MSAEILKAATEWVLENRRKIAGYSAAGTICIYQGACGVPMRGPCPPPPPTPTFGPVIEIIEEPYPPHPYLPTPTPTSTPAPTPQ